MREWIWSPILKKKNHCKDIPEIIILSFLNLWLGRIFENAQGESIWRYCWDIVRRKYHEGRILKISQGESIWKYHAGRLFKNLARGEYSKSANNDERVSHERRHQSLSFFASILSDTRSIYMCKQTWGFLVNRVNIYLINGFYHRFACITTTRRFLSRWMTPLTARRSTSTSNQHLLSFHT